MKILLCQYDTESSSSALEMTKKQAQAFNAEVCVVTSLLDDNKGHAFKSNEMEVRKRNLEAARAYFSDHNIPCRTELLIRGLEPGEDIVGYAQENHFDMIVLSVRRRSRISKLLLGSTAQYLILKSHCPVIAVK